MTRIIVTAHMRGSDEQRILLDEEVRPEHMSDKHSASQLLERLGWAVSDAERVAAVGVRCPSPDPGMPHGLRARRADVGAATRGADCGGYTGSQSAR
jgi:hypothetical protein